MKPIRGRAQKLLLLALLFSVAWGRVWAGVPQIVEHDHSHNDNHAVEIAFADHGNHHELIDLVPEHHPGHGEHAESGSEHHHHHLHLCSAGGSGITGQHDLQLTTPVISLRVDTQRATSIIRRHERLLRPPQA